MKIIDKYILKRFISTFIFCLLALAVIAIVIDYTEKVDSFVSKKVTGKEIFIYYITFVPYITALLFPLFVFVSVIFFTSRLSYKSEIIAMYSSGMSFTRFLFPYVIGGILFSLLLLYSNHVIIPKANRIRLNFENKYTTTNAIKSENDMHIRISKTEFIYLKSFNIDNNTGYNFTYEKMLNQNISEKVWSENIVWDSLKKNWILKNVRIRKNNAEKETMETVSIVTRNYPFYPADLKEESEVRQAMTTKQLNAFIDRETEKGNPALNYYKVEKYRRSAAPFSVFILTIIGACMSSQKVRGGSGVHMAIGLLISAGYIIFMQFSTTFSVKGNLHPNLSVWIPNFLFTIVAIFIYKKYNK